MSVRTASRRGVLLGLAAGTVVVGPLGWPGSATACVPEMPLARLPGETDTQLEARREERWREGQRSGQQYLWSRADRVYLARAIEPPEPAAPPVRPHDPRRDGPPRPPRYEPPPPIFRSTTILEAVSALKGTRPMRRLEVSFGFNDYDCTPTWVSDVRGAKPGDQFVVFLKSWAIEQENLIETVKLERVLDPRLKAALDDIL